MWEAKAEYADGTTEERYFSANENISENEDQYNLECWLLGWHKDCVWYSVNWVNE